MPQYKWSEVVLVRRPTTATGTLPKDHGLQEEIPGLQGDIPGLQEDILGLQEDPLEDLGLHTEIIATETDHRHTETAGLDRHLTEIRGTNDKTSEIREMNQIITEDRGTVTATTIGQVHLDSIDLDHLD